MDGQGKCNPFLLFKSLQSNYLDGLAIGMAFQLPNEFSIGYSFHSSKVSLNSMAIDREKLTKVVSTVIFFCFKKKQEKVDFRNFMHKMICLI